MRAVVCYAKRNPTWERGPVFGNERTTLLPAGLQKNVVCGVDIGPILPRGNMLNICLWAKTFDGFGNIRRDMGIQEQPGSHTRMNE